MMFKIFFLSMMFCCFSNENVVDTSNNYGWTFVKEQNGAKLYNRSVDGFEYKEVKVTLDLNVDVKKAKTFLSDPNNIEKWLSGCSMSVTKKKGLSYNEYYAIFDAPWPISDRDDYGRINLVEDTDQTLHFSFNSIPKGTPLVSNLVRVEYSKGLVMIETNARGKKTLVYQMIVDRGGSLPNYLKEYLQNSSPLDTIAKLKEQLEML